MFESHDRLGEQIRMILAAVADLAGGSYVCLLEPKGILFEHAEPEERETWALRRLLEERSGALFGIPKSLASGEPMEDVFEGWSHEELFLAFINERVVLVVACTEAEPLKERALPILKVLADRLLRYNGAYRMDEKGRGFFFSRPKLDLVVVERAAE
jgi:hypothetical protein